MAVVSHELRSPIHGICGLSEALALHFRPVCRLSRNKVAQS